MKRTRKCFCGCSRLTIKMTLFLQHFRCWAWQFHFQNYLYSQKTITAFPLFSFMIFFFCLYFIKLASSLQAWFQTIVVQSGKILSERDCSFLAIKASFSVPSYFYLSVLFSFFCSFDPMLCRGDSDESFTWSVYAHSWGTLLKLPFFLFTKVLLVLQVLLPEHAVWKQSITITILSHWNRGSSYFAKLVPVSITIG